MLNLGDVAPDFELQSQTGDLVGLRSFRGKQNVVLFFYPKDNTSVCSKEACLFRDSYSDFATQNTAVLGISSDNVDSHKKFSSKYQLPFPLLADAAGRIRRLYQVPKTFGVMPGRVTFVIDKQGIVRGIFVSQFKAERHISGALRTLESQTSR